MDVYANPIDSDRLSVELSQSVTRFRRALQRSARASFGEESLSPTEVELLLVVASRPGSGVAEVATELGAAPNTVSTLIRRLVSIGLLRREFSAADRRVAHLVLTDQAEARIESWRGTRADVLTEALNSLEADQQAVLHEAVPLLDSLAMSLYRPRRRAS